MIYYLYILYYNRNKVKHYFGVSNICDYNELHKSYFGKGKIYQTYKLFVTHMSKVTKKNKRNIQMFCAGGTIGAARKPFIRTGFNTRTMLPRPFQKSIPGESGHFFFRQNWVCSFFQDIEKIALDYIFYICPPSEQKEKNIKWVTDSKKLIPFDLRICNTFFTQISLIGDMSYETGQQNICPHVDLDDLFTIIIHFGFPSKGGDLLIFGGNSKTNIGSVLKVNNFRNGNVHMGCFTDVVHAVNPWNGIRGSFSLNLKKSMLDFFRIKDNLCYYTSYCQDGYPKKDHYTIN